MNQLFEDKKREIGDAARNALMRIKPKKRELDVNEFRFQLDLRKKISTSG